MQKTEFLGQDRFSKRWFVLLAEGGETGVFHVLASATSLKNADWDSPYIFNASVQKIPCRLAKFDIYGDEDFQNRGIGSLLLRYVEKWAQQSGVNTLYGFISPYDDVERLKRFYHRHGYNVELLDKAKKKSEGEGFYDVKVTKHLSKE